jgi:hypothetical protein
MIDAGRMAAKNYTPPNLGSMTRPTERPNEHVMAGTPTGPPPVMGAAPQNTGGISTMLAKMAATTNSPALGQLAARATSLGQ